MIWFGDTPFPIPGSAVTNRAGDDATRMEMGLRWVAERAPALSGEALVRALAGSGWVTADVAHRLLPRYRDFDADRHFAERLRSLSFRGPSMAGEFRLRIGQVVSDLVGDADSMRVGDEEVLRFRAGDREGVVLAYPEVAFTVNEARHSMIRSVVEAEIPHTLVVVARNFREGTEAQLRGMLHGTEVSGTVATVNRMLGMRAVALRYQPAPERVMEVLCRGGEVRSEDVARLGDRPALAA